MPLLDVLYMTRIQRERFASPEEYARQKGVYVLDKEKMKRAKADPRRPAPPAPCRRNHAGGGRRPRAKYFEQTEYGLYARMALIMKMLEGDVKHLSPVPAGEEESCGNPACITHAEPYLPHTFRKSGDLLVCNYCEERTLLR